MRHFENIFGSFTCYLLSHAITCYVLSEFRNSSLISIYIIIQLSLLLSFSKYIPLRHRSSRPEVFLRKGVLKICSKFKGEHPCQSAISTKFLRNFIEITLRHGCSPVNLLHIFRTPFLKNTSGRLLLKTTL